MIDHLLRSHFGSSDTNFRCNANLQDSSRTMSSPRSTAASSNGGGKAPRRQSKKQENSAFDCLVSSTFASDCEYIGTEMKGSLQPFVPLLASWIRDRKLHRALARASDQTDKGVPWPNTCQRVKCMGSLRFQKMFNRIELHFLDGMPLDIADLNNKTDEEYVILERRQKNLLTLENCAKFVAFAMGCKKDCFLPCKDVEESMLVMDKHYAALGNRLDGKTLVDFSWETDGIFTYDAENDPLMVTFNVDILSPKRTVPLPYPETLMDQTDDWKMEDNDDIDKAALVSKKLLLTCPVLPLFLNKFPDGTPGYWAFFELKSFEPDGTSQPVCFMNEAQKKKQNATVSIPAQKKRRGLASTKAAPTIVLPPRPLKQDAAAAVVALPAGAGLTIAQPPVG